MVQKRPLVQEDTLEVSNKHLRQTKIESYSEPIFPSPSIQESNVSDEVRLIGAEAREKFGYLVGIEQPGAKDIDSTLPGCHSLSSWGTSSTSEEDSGTDEPPHVPSFSEYFNPERPIRTLAHLEDVYSLLLEHPPRKPVPIGPNHQADISAWDSEVSTNIANHSSSSEADPDGYEKALMGTCIIPMPDVESSTCDGKTVGNGRSDCSCDDKGSMRCVRQHVVEARDDLKKSLGFERFVELGFYDMGEFVAEKWSEEEEQLFHKVVFSNPVSLGWSFWNSLSAVFPYRTKKEIVSYYFNVFMLRKRAGQNRCASLSIDSDNDEWQGIDDSVEAGMSDDDEDSVVESPIYEDFGHSQVVFDENMDGTRGNGSATTNGSEPFPGKLVNGYGCHLESEIQGKMCYDKQGQDDSCTSSEKGIASLGTHLNVDNGDHWSGSFTGLSGESGHGYVLEHCDPKVWDSAYSTCQRSKIDFLPTCSMIEEVFGDGSWNYKPGDGKSLS